MINTYKETLSNGRILEIPYDTDKISDTCVECKQLIYADVIKNYEARGNYCAKCNSKFGLNQN